LIRKKNILGIYSHLTNTAQNAKILRCAKTRKTAQNARNFGIAAQNSGKSAEFGRAKTAQIFDEFLSIFGKSCILLGTFPYKCRIFFV